MTGDLSVTANFAVVPGYLSISAATNSQNVSQSQVGEYAINLAPQNNLSGTANLSCSGLPAHSSCSFQPNGFKFPQTLTSMLSIYTNSSAAAYIPSPAKDGRGISFQLPTFSLMRLLFFALGWGPDHRKKKALFALALALSLFHGCGGSGGGGGTSPLPPSNSGTPAGTYAITISAQVGTVTQSTTVSIIVQ